MSRSRMRTPLPYYGAKVSMAKRIAEALPTHTVYIEPMCGSAAVFHVKQPAAVSVLSDLNPYPLAALRAIQSRPAELLDALPATIGNEQWREAITTIRNGKLSGCDVTDGMTMIVGWWSAFNSSPWSGAMSQRMCDQYARALASGETAKRIDYSHQLLKSTIIEQRDAIDSLQREARPGVLFFLDPPYQRFEHGGGSRGAAYGGYGPWEPDAMWHRELLVAVIAADEAGAIVALTSGKDQLYEDMLTEAGFINVYTHGREGRGPGRGGTGTAKHLLWLPSRATGQLLGVL